MSYRFWMGAILLALVPTAGFADSALTIKETVVRSAPALKAQQIAVLAGGEAVELKTRQGGWYRIGLRNGQSGWLPLLSVRKLGTAPKHEKSSGLGSLLSTYRTGSSGVTVATGVRGLDAVDLQNSKPDLEELGRIDAYLCDAAEARAYAARSGLVSRDVAWIEAPAQQEVSQ